MIEFNLEQELRKKAYLKGKTLEFSKFVPRFPADHTFCVFCWARISAWEEDLQDGYLEKESDNWVCDICMEEFQQAFEWTVNGNDDSSWQQFLQNYSFDVPLI